MTTHLEGRWVNGMDGQRNEEINGWMDRESDSSYICPW